MSIEIIYTVEYYSSVVEAFYDDHECAYEYRVQLDGKLLTRSKNGYGCAGAALRAGLNFAGGDDA